MTVGRPKVSIVNVDGINHKWCPGCQRAKPLTDFARDTSKSDGRTSYCKECRNNYKRRRRLIHPCDWKKYANKQSDGARNKVRKAVLSGKLIKPLYCVACGKKCKVEGHHRDYNKPLDVIWLCKDCHAFVHSGAFTFHGEEETNEK